MSLEDKVCIGCEGLEELEQYADEYRNASRSIDVHIPRDDGGVNIVTVPRGSLFDHPREDGIAHVYEKLEEKVEVDLEEPLRCIGSCDFICRAAGVIVPPFEITRCKDGPVARRVFYNTLSVVNEEHRQLIIWKSQQPRDRNSDY